MTGHEFEVGIGLIYSRWGQKNYPEQLRARIWYHCRHLPYKSFEKIILTLIDTSRAAPMPKEFASLAYAEMDRLGLRGKSEPETKPSKEAKCWDCGDSGNLWVKRKEQHEKWAKWPSGIVRCHCEVGQNRPRAQGAIWSDDVIGKSYLKDPIYRRNQGDWRPKPDQSLVDMFQMLTGKPTKSTRKSELTNISSLFEGSKDAW